MGEGVVGVGCIAKNLGSDSKISVWKGVYTCLESK